MRKPNATPAYWVEHMSARLPPEGKTRRISGDARILSYPFRQPIQRFPDRNRKWSKVQDGHCTAVGGGRRPSYRRRNPQFRGHLGRPSVRIWSVRLAAPAGFTRCILRTFSGITCEKIAFFAWKGEKGDLLMLLFNFLFFSDETALSPAADKEGRHHPGASPRSSVTCHPPDGHTAQRVLGYQVVYFGPTTSTAPGRHQT